MISKNTKEEIIMRLLRTKEKSHTLQIRLALKGKTQESNEVAEKSAELTKSIDSLIGSVMNNWAGQAASTTASIKTGNEQLQRTITDIKNNVKTAKNIVKAVGLIDDAVKIASRFV